MSVTRSTTKVTDSIILTHPKAPGDVVVFSAVVRDLAIHRPDLKIGVEVYHPAVFEHNPHLCSAVSHHAPRIKLGYGQGIERTKTQPHHFLTAFHYDLKHQLGWDVPLTLPRPDLHLSELEKANPPLMGRYWVVMAGGKSDITIKHWRPSWYQAVADQLRERGIHCVQCGDGRGTPENPHTHWPLQGVTNLVNRTSLRDFIRVVAGAEGVIAPITCAMHLAAAFEKPCVVIAGGRESPAWEGYDPQYNGFGSQSALIRVPHRYLHTMTKLECCKHLHVGCWKKHVVDIGRGNKLCHQPVLEAGEPPIANCMRMIQPADVVAGVMSYYQDGTLPPIIDNGPPVVSDRLTVRSSLAAVATMPQVLRPEKLPDLAGTAAGPLTIAVYLQGNFPWLHRDCLVSLRNTLPESPQIDLRILTSSCPAETDTVLDRFSWSGVRQEATEPKAAIIRDLLQAVTTRYLLWIEDTEVLHNPRWLLALLETITNNHPQGARLYGRRQIVPLVLNRSKRRDDFAWFKRAAWFRGRAWQDSSGQLAPNGDKIHCVSPGFWAVATDLFKADRILDTRLRNRGIEACLGAQVHQAGYRIKDFDSKHDHIIHHDAGPRAGDEPCDPWAATSDPAQP